MIFASMALCTAVHAQEAADTYEVEETKETAKEQKKLPYQNKVLRSKDTNFILGDSPVELGAGSLFEYNMLGTKLVQNEVTYFYYPKAKAVVLKITSLQANYYIYLTRENCKTMKAAFNQYLKDFDAHVLVNSKKTYSIYGTITTEYRQGMIGTATVTKPKTTIGYTFVKKSPYFDFILWPADGEPFIPGTDVEKGEGSSKMSFFMTKKQGSKMLEFIDDSVFVQMEDLQNSLLQEEQEADQY